MSFEQSTGQEKSAPKKVINLTLKSDANWSAQMQNVKKNPGKDRANSTDISMRNDGRQEAPKSKNQRPRGQHNRAQQQNKKQQNDSWDSEKDQAFDLPSAPIKSSASSLDEVARPGFRKPQEKKQRERKTNDGNDTASLFNNPAPLQRAPSNENNSQPTKRKSAPSQPDLYENSAPTFETYRNKLSAVIVDTLLNDMKFTKMTPVQAHTIVPLLNNRDCHVQAKTGTGKTVSFLVPSIQKILVKSKRSGISLLVISPTRELAMQIATEAKAITQHIPGIKIGISIGGTNINSEKNAIMSGLDILIATPGRLLDHLSDAKISSQVYYLDTFVLDECDRLLDMGFSPDIFKILKHLPTENRQSILCSATVTPRVKEIASKLLKQDHDFVSTVPKGDVDTHQKVPQFMVQSPFTEQLLMTITLLQLEASPKLKAIVFLPTAHLANLYYATYAASFPRNTFVQHSRQSQSKRQKVSDDYKDCSSGILFATDVVARGMDYPNVSHVFQVGLPDSRETYIHRIGRTGRAEADGKGFIILSPEESFFMHSIKGFPITTLAPPLFSGALSIQSKGVNAFKQDPRAATQVYQSWLGYYKGEMKKLGFSAEKLVHAANVFADAVLGCNPPPGIEARVIGKMGLKGVKGLVKVNGIRR